MKNFLIITSGGDSPGMNVIVKYLVNYSINKKLVPFIAYEGFKGLYEGDYKMITKPDVKDIDKKGGTILHSSRFLEFKNKEIQKIAVDNLKKHDINTVVVIGGDGSYEGARKLKDLGINIICVPATIDNDIKGTDYSIGFSTAVETIVESIDKLSDTSESHSRINIIEVMGNNSGNLALYSGFSSGANIISTPENKLSEEEIIKEIKEKISLNYRSIIVVVTEKLYDINNLAKKIEAHTNRESRATSLGQIQRGGKPSSFERFISRIFASYTIDCILKNKFGICISYFEGKVTHHHINKIPSFDEKYRKIIYKKFLETK